MTTALEKSFKARIRNLGLEKQIDPAILWQNIVLERFLARLAQSPYVDHFILKGGTLLSKIIPIYRETKDLDFSLIGIPHTGEKIQAIIQEVIENHLNDGFSFTNLKLGELNHPSMMHKVTRIDMFGRFGKTRFKVFIDLGLGDFITPIERMLPLTSSKKGALFESHVELKCYPIEFMLAEKLQAILQRREDNSRMKDFHDLFIMSTKLADQFSANTQIIIERVFEYRKSPLNLPIEFSSKHLVILQIPWNRHLQSLKKGHPIPSDLRETISTINSWLLEKIILEPIRN